MSSNPLSEQFDEGLRRIEAALRGLSPMGGRLDRDRLMYLAGQASAVGPEAQESATRVASYTDTPVKVAPAYKHYGWPLATAASLLLAMTLGGMLIFSPRPGERIVYVEGPNASGSAAMVSFLPAPADSSHAASSEQNNYLRLRNLVLTRGVDAMPAENKASGQQRAEQTPSWPMLRQQFFKAEKDGST
jgi:hypothetical protein